MNVKQVKDIATQLVTEEASKMSDFYGDYFIGSINWMPDDAAFPSTSDVDVQIAFEDPDSPYEHASFSIKTLFLKSVMSQLVAFNHPIQYWQTIRPLAISQGQVLLPTHPVS